MRTEPPSLPLLLEIRQSPWEPVLGNRTHPEDLREVIEVRLTPVGVRWLVVITTLPPRARLSDHDKQAHIKLHLRLCE